MANILPIAKKIACISALAEGNSIRSVECMTGVHRDTIMRLGAMIGNGCTRLMDEIWGFVGKKNENASPADRHSGLRDVWTFVDPRADQGRTGRGEIEGSEDSTAQRDCGSRIAELLKQSPRPSVRMISREVGVSFGTVAKVAKQIRQRSTFSVLSPE